MTVTSNVQLGEYSPTAPLFHAASARGARSRVFLREKSPDPAHWNRRTRHAEKRYVGFSSIYRAVSCAPNGSIYEYSAPMTSPIGHASASSVGADQEHAGSHLAQARSVRHILVCLDRSRLAEACLPHARFVAEAFGAKITLLHVMPSPGDEPATSRPDALGWEITRREAEEYLTSMQDQLVRQGCVREQTDTELTQGRPAERIVTLARELGADVTVLASHGEGGLGALNLGSTAQQVLALASSSVLIAPSDVAPWRNVPAKRIIVPLDGSLRTECVLPAVAQLARHHGAEALLVHVVAEPRPTAVLSTSEDLALSRSLAAHLQSEAERYLSRLRKRLVPEVSRVATLVVRRADERRALLEAAEERQADLLVLAAHGTTCDTERAFGSVAAYLLAHGKVPLLVLQDLPVTERDSHRPMPVDGTQAGARASFGARAVEGN
jgi:nucleotide-binding universal stress UspA family protein